MSPRSRRLTLAINVVVMTPREQRVAWIAENAEGEFGGPSGSFRCHWERRVGPDEPGPDDAADADVDAVEGFYGPGLRAVPLDEALRWSRAHAAHVILRLADDGMFSAGEIRKRALPEWPE